MMNQRKQVAKDYIAHLANGNVESLVELFAVDGTVESPLYGHMQASQFYQELFSDTTQSELQVKGIFEDQESNSIALYFNYIWTMKNDEVAEFDVVDIIKFDLQGKIENLKIIYDTVKSREFLKKLKEDSK
jgi:ketosteroid isomerase-like protein